MAVLRLEELERLGVRHRHDMAVSITCWFCLWGFLYEGLYYLASIFRPLASGNSQMRGSINREPKNRPQHTMILLQGLPKRALNFWKPLYRALKTPNGNPVILGIQNQRILNQILIETSGLVGRENGRSSRGPREVRTAGAANSRNTCQGLRRYQALKEYMVYSIWHVVYGI